MGLRSALRARSSGDGTTEPGGAAAAPRAWYDELQRTARAHGAYPYLVEGFMEIVEAVRRGHSVLVPRVTAEVADGITVFGSPPRSLAAPGTPLASLVANAGEDLVTILRFNPGTARYELLDVTSGPGAAVELTPKRLQRYLATMDDQTGIALGA